MQSKIQYIWGTKNSESDTPLIAAARAGQTGMVQQLLAAKADVNEANNDGDTALIAAAEGNHPEIVVQPANSLQI